MPSSSDSKIRKGSFRPVSSAQPSRAGLTYGAGASTGGEDDPFQAEWCRIAPLERPGMPVLDITESARRNPNSVMVDVEVGSYADIDVKFTEGNFGKVKYSLRPRIYHLGGGVSGTRAYVANRVQGVAPGGQLVVIRDNPRQIAHPKKGPYRT